MTTTLGSYDVTLESGVSFLQSNADYSFSMYFQLIPLMTNDNYCFLYVNNTSNYTFVSGISCIDQFKNKKTFEFIS